MSGRDRCFRMSTLRHGFRRHPLCAMRRLVNALLAALDGSFDRLHAKTARPSIAPERLLQAVVRQMLFSIRAERQVMEWLEFDLYFRWFVGLGIDDSVWHPTVFTHNRDRVLTWDVAQGFLSTLLAQPAVKTLLSAEHFSVDGTMLKAFASMKSFRVKDGGGGDHGEPPEGGRNGERDFRKEKRSNETHASTTDPDAPLYRKGNGQESRLAYLGHVLMENRNGLAVDGAVTLATGTGEREAASELSEGLAEGATLGADKGYDAEAFAQGLEEPKIVPLLRLMAWRATGARCARGRCRCRWRKVPVMRAAFAAASGSRDLRLGQDDGRPSTAQGARTR